MADSIDTQAEQLFEANGDLSPEDMFGLLAGVSGDTTTPVVEAAQPAAASDADTQAAKDAEAAAALAAAPAAAPAVADPAEDPANTVILAKDGKHTIGYEKLVEARDAAKAADARAAAAVAEAEALRAQLAAKPTAAPAPAPVKDPAAADPTGVDADGEPLFGDYTEEQMAKGVQKLIDKAVATAVAATEAKFEAKLAPVAAKATTDAATEHFKTIYTAHPDADSVWQSTEFAAWKATQPRVVQAAYNQVLEGGTASDIVEVFNAYRVAHPDATAAAPVAPVAAPASAKAKAAAIVNAAKANPKSPTSLTDIPAGAAAAVDEAGALTQMGDQDLLTKFGNMKPADIERTLAKML